MKLYKPLTKEELLARGFCCHNGCKNCPWKDKKEISTTSHRETENKTNNNNNLL